MIIWTLATKDLRLLIRDRRAVIILLVMPLVFILVLGISLGEGFGQKPDDRLRISLVDLDEGLPPEPAPLREVRQATALLSTAAGPAGLGALPFSQLAGAELVPEPWSKLVRRDLEQTAGIRVEVVPTRQEAEELIRARSRAAVLVFGPKFSQKIGQCSFLSGGINPFYRDGVNLQALDADFLRDDTQTAASAIIEQVAQVTLLRVVLPWMIGKAFDRLSDPAFINILGKQVKLPVPAAISFLVGAELQADGTWRAPLQNLIQTASANNRQLEAAYKAKVGEGVQGALAEQFSKYNLQAKTWAALTKSAEPADTGPGTEVYHDEGGTGLLKRGATRYQLLVPSSTVMFAFFLVLTVGWLFVAERRQGTLRRLRAAPVSRGQILFGKMVPCFVVSLAQGFLLLLAGKLVFGMNWGPEPLWLLPVVVSTSLAAVGLALLVAAAARTETQVAIYGSLLVLVLALVSGCVMPRAMMPEQAQRFSRLTPHAWALDAYAELLISATPNLAIVAVACLVLAGFGLVFTALAWWILDLEAA